MSQIIIAIGVLLVGVFIAVAGAVITIATIFLTDKKQLTLESLFGIAAIAFGISLAVWVSYVEMAS